MRLPTKATGGTRLISFRIGSFIGNHLLLQEAHQVERMLPSKVVFNQPSIPSLELLTEQLERERPDILFLDLGLVRHSLADLVTHIATVSAGTRIVALNMTPDPDRILETLRSGVSEFLVPPFQRTWEVAMDKLAAEIAAEKTGSPTGRQVIGVLSAKGGCGATTVACHLAASIRRQFRSKTLLMDLDLEAGGVGFLLRINSRYTIHDALEGIHRLDDSFWRALVAHADDDLDVLRSHMDLPPDLYPAADNVIRLLEFVRPLYNWTVLDLGRGLGYLTKSAIRQLDYTFLVTTFELPALRQAKHLIKVLTEQAYQKDRLQLIINRMPKSSSVSLNDLERLLGLPVYYTLANQYHPLMQAYEAGQLLDSSAKLGQEFSELASKIVGLEPSGASKERTSFLANIFTLQRG